MGILNKSTLATSYALHLNKKIATKLNALENSRKELLEKLRKVDKTLLNTPPAEGKWSVAQVIYHLNKAESLSAIYVSKKMQDINKLKETGFIEWLKIVILKIAFVSPIRFKAPVNVLGDVPINVDYTIIISEWNETRQRLVQLVYSMPEELLTKNVFKQPALGRLNVYQMLDFMQTHFDRHKRQIMAAIG